ncbi:MAG: hypothetical protein ACOCX1_00175, partial [Fimbriimonadaceae bacterium]
IARSVLGKGNADRVGHLLSGLGLWEVRQEPISQMTPSQALACDLFGVLLKPADLILVDGHLDAFDPWTLESVIETLGEIQSEGQALLVATNRSEIATQLGSLIVLNSQSPVFVGTVQELLNSCAPTELLVETDDESAVRSVAEPFDVRIEQTEEGLRLEAAEDQELAARLLCQGYGVVRSVVVRKPTLDEALKSLS